MVFSPIPQDCIVATSVATHDDDDDNNNNNNNNNGNNNNNNVNKQSYLSGRILSPLFPARFHYLYY